MARFKITSGKGFQIELSNGFKLSVQFGSDNYCENKNSNLLVMPGGDLEAGERGSKTAEIACFDSEGAFIQLGCDSVRGWVSTDAVASILGELVNAKTAKDVATIVNKYSDE